MGKIWGGRSIFCTLTIMPLCQKFKIILVFDCWVKDTSFYGQNANSGSFEKKLYFSMSRTCRISFRL
jgi:hypothetical protein